MPRLPKLLTILLTAALLTAATGVGEALASRGQVNYFEGGNLLLSPKQRPKAIAQMQHLGVKAVRIELYWHDVAPRANSASRPSFVATDPANYAWGEYDVLLNEAHKLGWRILLTVTAPAPRWATSNKKAPYVTKPGPKDFQEFMTAVGRHYGNIVTQFSIWNEPDHPAFLMPQWNRNGTPASPRIYRGLYQAGYSGLLAAGMAHPNVLFGETAPVGYATVNVRREGSRALLHPVAPLAFLRGALCLNSHYRRSGSCSELKMTGYAHHAYTNAAGPPTTRRNPTTSRSACSRACRARSIWRRRRTPSRRTCRCT